MQKTSVYLPEALKRRLQSYAAATNQSEAQLIRDAVESHLSQQADNSGAPARNEARLNPLEAALPGRLVGVGVGPGPTSMLTVGALRALRRADRVIAPCTALDAVGRAEAILRQAAPDIAVERMKFVMQPDHEARSDALKQVTKQIADYLEAGDEVAFITLGDPNTYSTVSSVFAGVAALRPSTVKETVPGIMAFQALASQGDVMLTDEQQTMVVLPASAPPEVISAELANPERTVIFYKGGGRIGLVADYLEDADRLDGAVLGELLGMAGEQVAPVLKVRDRPASYLSCVIAPAPEGAGPVPHEKATQAVTSSETNAAQATVSAP